jgi:Zn-dependent peptidase ImmA (M78 family)
LHACVVAFRGSGFIFLDSDNNLSERRFSTAHEIGHFLLDYWEKRQLAISRFGPSIEDVIDGIRPATVEERVHSMLSEVQITPFTHLMERKADGQLGCDSLQRSELHADSLALELLAPYETVKDRVNSRRKQDRQTYVQEILVADFGLPPQVAQKYMKAFQLQEADSSSVRKWLGI